MKRVVYQQNQEDNIPIDDNFMKYNTAEKGTKQASRLSSTKPQHHNQISSSSAALQLALVLSRQSHFVAVICLHLYNATVNVW
jgi:hypothetical protein